MEGERERSSPLNKLVRTISSRLFRNDGAQEIFSFPLIEPRSTVIFVQVATFFETESFAHHYYTVNSWKRKDRKLLWYLNIKATTRVP